MSLLKHIIRIAAPAPELESFERYLFIGPHPDDIEIGAGASAAKLAAEGKQIRFLVCTDGRFGDGNMPKGTSSDKVAEIREEEAKASAEYLGIKDIRFLRFSDGGFYDNQKLLEAVAKEVGEFKPDVILAPDPCVTSECHADHINVGKAARQIACFAPYQGIMSQYGAESADVKAIAFYMTAKPNHYIRTSGYLKKQLESICKCHPSQFGGKEFDTLKLYLKLRAVDFGLRSFSKNAEGFRVLGQTQMHCLPEAGD